MNHISTMYGMLTTATMATVNLGLNMAAYPGYSLVAIAGMTGLGVVDRYVYPVVETSMKTVADLSINQVAVPLASHVTASLAGGVSKVAVVVTKEVASAMVQTAKEQMPSMHDVVWSAPPVNTVGLVEFVAAKAKDIEMSLESNPMLVGAVILTVTTIAALALYAMARKAKARQATTKTQSAGKACL